MFSFNELFFALILIFISTISSSEVQSNNHFPTSHFYIFPSQNHICKRVGGCQNNLFSTLKDLIISNDQFTLQETLESENQLISLNIENLLKLFTFVANSKNIQIQHLIFSNNEIILRLLSLKEESKALFKDSKFLNGIKKNSVKILTLASAHENSALIDLLTLEPKIMNSISGLDLIDIILAAEPDENAIKIPKILTQNVIMTLGNRILHSPQTRKAFLYSNFEKIKPMLGCFLMQAVNTENSEFAGFLTLDDTFLEHISSPAIINSLAPVFIDGLVPDKVRIILLKNIDKVFDIITNHPSLIESDVFLQKFTQEALQILLNIAIMNSKYEISKQICSSLKYMSRLDHSYTLTSFTGSMNPDMQNMMIKSSIFMDMTEEYFKHRDSSVNLNFPGLSKVKFAFIIRCIERNMLHTLKTIFSFSESTMQLTIFQILKIITTPKTFEIRELLFHDEIFMDILDKNMDNIKIKILERPENSQIITDLGYLLIYAAKSRKSTLYTMLINSKIVENIENLILLRAMALYFDVQQDVSIEDLNFVVASIKEITENPEKVSVEIFVEQVEPVALQNIAAIALQHKLYEFISFMLKNQMFDILSAPQLISIITEEFINHNNIFEETLKSPNVLTRFMDPQSNLILLMKNLKNANSLCIRIIEIFLERSDTKVFESFYLDKDFLNRLEIWEFLNLYSFAIFKNRKVYEIVKLHRTHPIFNHKIFNYIRMKINECDSNDCLDQIMPFLSFNTVHRILGYAIKNAEMRSIEYMLTKYEKIKVIPLAYIWDLFSYASNEETVDLLLADTKFLSRLESTKREKILKSPKSLNSKFAMNYLLIKAARENRHKLVDVLKSNDYLFSETDTETWIMAKRIAQESEFSEIQEMLVNVPIEDY